MCGEISGVFISYNAFSLVSIKKEIFGERVEDDPPFIMPPPELCEF